MTPVFVIHLARAEERRAHMEAQLARLRARWELVPGVDGVRLSDEELRRLGGPRALDPWPEVGGALTRSELGCALSHLALYRRVVEEGLEAACILEDDVELAPDFDDVLEAVEAAPARCEMILLGNQSARYDFSRGAAISAWARRVGGGGRRLGRIVEFPLGAFAYVIRRAGAEKMLRWAHPVRMPADWATGYSPNSGLGLYGVRPPCVIPLTKTFASTIPDRGAGGAPGALTYRGPVWWRTRAAAGRLFLLARRLGFLPYGYCRRGV